MNYDFNKVINRKGTDCEKFDNLAKTYGTHDAIPLWVADSDLPTSQPLVDALIKRAEHPAFGYSFRSDEYIGAVVDWQKNRNGWELDSELLGFASGVMTSVSTSINLFTNEGDSVVIFTPVYPPFHRVVTDWQRSLIACPMLEDNGYYSIDFAAFETVLKLNRPKALLLCNPHNPVGRVWNKSEITRLGELCVTYDVLIISDEIHSDIILFGNRHIPIASLGKDIAAQTITCFSPTKTFNIAGLKESMVVFPNAEMKEQFDSYLDRLHISDPNIFGITGAHAAYSNGSQWLAQLLPYYEDNLRFVKSYLDSNLPQIKTHLPEATYLMWLDCRQLGMDSQKLGEFFLKNAGLALNNGLTFGSDGEGFMRLNVSCSRMVLQKALDQLSSAVAKL